MSDTPRTDATQHQWTRTLKLARTLERELAAVTRERDEAHDRLLRSGFVRCDIAACNCGSWHQRYGLPERMREIEQTLEDAGHPLDNDNGHLIRNALAQLVDERDTLRAEVERLRGLCLLTLEHHQGAGSPVGQRIRRALGIGQFDRLTPEQRAEAERAAL